MDHVHRIHDNEREPRYQQRQDKLLVNWWVETHARSLPFHSCEKERRRLFFFFDGKRGGAFPGLGCRWFNHTIELVAVGFWLVPCRPLQKPRGYSAEEADVEKLRYREASSIFHPWTPSPCTRSPASPPGLQATSSPSLSSSPQCKHTYTPAVCFVWLDRRGERFLTTDCVSCCCVFRPTFKRILKAKSTEQFDGLPYLLSLLNCFICLWYGLPWVSDGRLLVATVNGTGAAFQLAYISLFFIYADSRKTRVISFPAWTRFTFIP